MLISWKSEWCWNYSIIHQSLHEKKFQKQILIKFYIYAVFLCLQQVTSIKWNTKNLLVRCRWWFQLLARETRVNTLALLLINLAKLFAPSTSNPKVSTWQQFCSPLLDYDQLMTIPWLSIISLWQTYHLWCLSLNMFGWYLGLQPVRRDVQLVEQQLQQQHSNTGKFSKEFFSLFIIQIVNRFFILLELLMYNIWNCHIDFRWFIMQLLLLN